MDTWHIGTSMGEACIRQITVSLWPLWLWQAQLAQSRTRFHRHKSTREVSEHAKRSSAEAGDPRRKPQPRAFAMFSKMRHSEVHPRSAKARTAGEDSTTEDVSEILLVFAGLLGPLQCAEEPCGARASVGTKEGGRGQGVLTPRHWREADSRALVGSDDGSLSLWRVESGECLARPSWAWGVSRLFLCETCAKNSLAAGLPATSASCGQFMLTGPVAKFHSRPFLHMGTRGPRIRGSGTRSVWSLRWLPKTLGPRALCAKRWS